MPTRTPGGEHDYRGIGTIGALRQGCPQVAQKRGGHCGWKRRSKVKVRDRCAWTPWLGRRRAFSWKLENPRGILNWGITDLYCISKGSLLGLRGRSPKGRCRNTKCWEKLEWWMIEFITKLIHVVYSTWKKLLWYSQIFYTEHSFDKFLTTVSQSNDNILNIFHWLYLKIKAIIHKY